MPILHIPIITLFLFSFSFANASEIRTIDINGHKIYYHFIGATSETKGLLLFLHGSVKAFQGKEKSEAVPTEILLEGNNQFIETFREYGYDIIMPISFNDFNWLDPKGNAVVDSIFQRHAPAYNRIYISGFSDGGTGSYRYFYTNPERYAGAVIFNGYPQLNNFNKKVAYQKVNNKNIIFYSQESDKVVPFEFLLTEYRRQKQVNEMTYFILKNGRHEFVKYTKTDFEDCVRLLEEKPAAHYTTEDSITIYPPLDAYIIKGKIIDVYNFRPRIGKSYGMISLEYRVKNDIAFNKTKDSIFISPIKIAKKDMASSEFDYPVEINGKESTIRLTNFLSFRAW